MKPNQPEKGKNKTNKRPEFQNDAAKAKDCNHDYKFNDREQSLISSSLASLAQALLLITLLISRFPLLPSPSLFFRNQLFTLYAIDFSNLFTFSASLALDVAQHRTVRNTHASTCNCILMVWLSYTWRGRQTGLGCRRSKYIINEFLVQFLAYIWAVTC